ncbi:MAG: malto-oligosyltrehalose synthase [Frankiales bacterium]|nr:malto-oligosyltrehalose synthase [Frankiales bacterium]
MIRSTYRLQLTPSFGFDDAAAVVPYLARLGITHLYCSPWLASARGSQHGYDVVDHSRVDDELGGPEALARLHQTCQDHGLGIVLDIVPNHMTIAAPEDRNAQWWSVLREGQASPYRDWFDVDWSRRLLAPVLGGPLADVVGELELTEDTVTYYEHVFPLAPGTLVPGDVLGTLDRQHYRIADWHTATEESTHRRFFDVTTLAGLRVEDPAVFDATHALILRQVADGIVDGLRVDHPDGLADPAGYLARLREQTGGLWVVAEKILEHGEELPHWECAGTTGYDALNLVTGLFVDPAGEQPLTSLWESLTGDTSAWDEVVEASKRQVLNQVLSAEVERLVDLAKPLCDAAHLDITRRGLREALVEVLVAFDVYRAYLPERAATVRWAGETAAARLPHRAREIAVLVELVLQPGELATRFQQTCGPAMAKGVEDTAFYRYLPLLALNEVGGDPGHWGTAVEDFHEHCARMLAQWPDTMTTLSTHDTKRSEDVRARLALLSQHAVEWGEAVTQWTAWLPRRLDPPTEQLIWQTLVGAWPIDADRAVAYVGKATHEAKARTSWLEPDSGYDEAAAGYVRALLADAHLVGEISAFVKRLAGPWRSTVLAQKLVQLTMPGVADTYQGCELVDLSLVDPDNRRPVDYARRVALLDAPDGSLDSEKLRLVQAALAVRDRLDGYDPLEAAPTTLAYRRGPVAVAVPLRGGAAELELDGYDDLLPDLPVRLLLLRG